MAAAPWIFVEFTILLLGNVPFWEKCFHRTAKSFPTPNETSAELGQARSI
jgi:hypothetical protein